MPCNDGMGPFGSSRVEYVDNPKIAAALCGILSALAGRGQDELNRTLSNVDWREAGVTRDYVETWWREHKEADRRRRAREEKRRADQEAAEYAKWVELNKKFGKRK